MALSEPPPILEVEDLDPSLSSFTRAQTPIHDNSSSRPALGTQSQENIGRDIGREYEESKEENRTGQPTLGPDPPSRTINDHTQFWSTYDKLTDSYDKELLDAWNKSLDVLLIFAGLFSAVNTAFIIESYKGLQPDPAEITNDLLRLFITHRSDNITLSFEDLNPGSPSQSAIPINFIFFSSLSFSLTAAFGAVTAKQWLTEYANVGGMRALYTQGRRRQEKYNGLKTWHLRLIIELLPMLLQISLLLFLVGVVHMLWMLDRTVAIEQLLLSAGGLAIYVATIIIGIVVPTSPFQTPLSRYLPRFFDKVRRGFDPFTKASRSSAPDPGTDEEPTASATTPISEGRWASSIEYLRSRIGPYLSGFTQWIRIPSLRDKSISEGTELDGPRWDKEDTSAAEAIIWVLEQAEHPDVTIIALDAVPQLPPDLLLSMVQQREGLLERLIQFHNSLLPPRTPSNGGLEWIKSWPNKAIVTGTALHHILKSRRLDDSDGVNKAIIKSLNTSNFRWKDEKEGDPIAITKYLVNLNLALGNSYRGIHSEKNHLLEFLDCVSHSLVCSPPLGVELMDAPQGLIGGSFITAASSIEMTLDFIIRLVFQSPEFHKEDLRKAFEHFDKLLHQGELPRGAVSHLAITVVAMCSKLMHNYGQREYSFPDDRKQLLITGCFAIDKRAMLLKNIALALSMIDIYDDDECDHVPGIFSTLFKIASPIIDDECQILDWTKFHLFEAMLRPDSVIPYPNFAPSLLHLSTMLHLDDKERLRIVGYLLCCPDGDWIVPTTPLLRSAISQLLGPVLSDQDNAVLALALLERMAQMSDDSQFLDIIKSRTCIYPHFKLIADYRPHSEAGFSDKLISKTLLLQDLDSPGSSELLEIQIYFAVTKFNRSRLVHETITFLGRMVEQDSELYWPAYFTSVGIVRLTSAEPHIPLKIIDPGHVFDLLRSGSNYCTEHVSHVWGGEALLMLWRKWKRECSNGRLPRDWANRFFEGSALIEMKVYYQHIRMHAYMGVDWDLVKEYFSETLDAMQKGGYNFGSLWMSSKEQKISEVEKIVDGLRGYSNDHPPPHARPASVQR